MGRVLPILFNGDMVRAILDGRKTVTRRIVKYKYNNTEMKMKSDKYGARLIEIQKDVEGETYGKNSDGSTWRKLRPYIEKNPPYKKGDILYVRETWAFKECNVCKQIDCHKMPTTHQEDETPTEGCYIYRADHHPHLERITWCPSIHMPKEASRIWLKVTDVRIERLQEATSPIKYPHGKDNTILREGFKCTYEFIDCWNSTIKKQDLERYGWDVNPWVWVIEFERCGKPDSCIVKSIEPASDNRPCIGYQKSKEDDEPCEMCKGCKCVMARSRKARYDESNTGDGDARELP